MATERDDDTPLMAGHVASLEHGGVLGAMMDDPDNAASRAAAYWRGWIESTLIRKIET
jgi:hypothetical protein